MGCCEGKKEKEMCDVCFWEFQLKLRLLVEKFRKG